MKTIDRQSGPATTAPQGRLVRETVGGEGYEYYPLGEHIVSAPGVCGGEPTFKYTRINVAFILERLEAGETRDDLVTADRGRLSPEALDEAIRLADRLPIPAARHAPRPR